MRDIVELTNGTHVAVDTQNTMDNGWETMVFECGPDSYILDLDDLDVMRYPDEETAIIGHKEMVEKWRNYKSYSYLINQALEQEHLKERRVIKLKVYHFVYAMEGGFGECDIELDIDTRITPSGLQKIKNNIQDKIGKKIIILSWQEYEWTDD